MTKIKPVKAWAVVDPQGDIIHVGMGASEYVIFECFGLPYGTEQQQEESLKRWDWLGEQGFRCIPVTITPEGE